MVAEVSTGIDSAPHRNVRALLLFLCSFAIACSTGGEETSVSSASAATSSEEGDGSDGFIGCRPSPGECRYSCPSGRAFRFAMNDERCPGPFGDRFYDRGACFCGDGTTAPDPEPNTPPEY
jgi:hypothetical protein